MKIRFYIKLVVMFFVVIYAEIEGDVHENETKLNGANICTKTVSSIKSEQTTYIHTHVGHNCPHFKCFGDYKTTKILTKNDTRQITKQSFFCCAGYTKNNSGDKCVSTCPSTCVNGKCNQNKCSCDPGYKGQFCNENCVNNTFGVDCVNECKCSRYGKCNPKIGCVCDNGYIGKMCENKCSEGYFGHNCTSVCQECPFYQLCDHIYGSCECKHGCRGPLCSIQYIDGVDCQKHCQCQNDGKCDTSGKCTCRSGYMGEKCSEECPSNRYGSNCSQLCKCELCNSINGKCICKPGWIGEYCNEACSMQTYGKNCTSKCDCKNNSTCSPFTGICNCLDGWTGILCDYKCSLGNFGFKCEKKCFCDFLNTEQCDPINGTCYCKKNWTGHMCDQKVFSKRDTEEGDEDSITQNKSEGLTKFIAIAVVSCILLLAIVICGYKMFVKIFEIKFRNSEYECNSGGAARALSVNGTELAQYNRNYGPSQLSNIYEEIIYDEARQNPDTFYDQLDFQRPITKSSSNYTIIRSQK